MNEAERYLEKKMTSDNTENSMQEAHEASAPISKVSADVKKKGLAIASLVCAIIGGWASTACIPAVICGHMALNKVNKEPDVYAGKGIAIAGLILGYFGLVLAVVVGTMRGTLNLVGY